MNAEEIIENLWEEKDKLDNQVEQDRARQILSKVMDMLDTGEIRVAEIKDNEVVVNEWVKRAILLYFRVQQMVKMVKGNKMIKNFLIKDHDI